MSKPSELLEVEKLEKARTLPDAIKRWNREYQELKDAEYKEKFGSKKYFELSKKRAIIGEKLRWASMQPEMRKAQIDAQKDLEKIGKERSRMLEELKANCHPHSSKYAGK